MSNLGSSLLMLCSLLSLSIISMFLFDCWVSLSLRGIISYNERLTHCVLFVADTTVKETPRPLFPSFIFVVRPFFKQKWGNLSSFTTAISTVDMFWRSVWLWPLYSCCLRNAKVYSLFVVNLTITSKYHKLMKVLKKWLIHVMNI